MLIKYSTQKTNVAQAIRHIDASGTNECARMHVRLAAVCMQHISIDGGRIAYLSGPKVRCNAMALSNVSETSVGVESSSERGRAIYMAFKQCQRNFGGSIK